MKIGSWNSEKDILVIAEVGNNHEGNFDRACDMVKAAAKAGAGAVKFQTIIPEKLVSLSDRQRIEQLTKFQFTQDQFRQLADEAKKEGVLFLSTPFDIESARFLEPLVPAFKIASSDNNFYPLIEVIAKTGKPILLSTGLANLAQISETESFIDRIWRKEGIDQELAFLHCVASYPAPKEEANLLAIRGLQEEFGGVVGYSDHTLGIDAAVIAAALGARVIEKHFTLDRNLSDFRDHKIAADPEELKTLVEKVKQTQILMGDGSLSPRKSEQEMILKLRRSIVAEHDLKEGTVVSAADLTWVRPGGGLPPGDEDQILGKTLAKNISKGQRISVSDLRG